MALTFVTTRGNSISCPHGHHPQQGRIGGSYPKIDKVSEGLELVGNLCLNLLKIVTEARTIAEDLAIDGFGHLNPQLGQGDNLFYNALAIDWLIKGSLCRRDLLTNEAQFFRLMRMGILDGREGYNMLMTASTTAMRHTAAITLRLWVMFEHEHQRVCSLGMSD